MEIKKLNSLFQSVQAGQLSLLTLQGLFMILNGTDKFYLPLWIGLAVLSIFQVFLIFKYPHQVEIKQVVNRNQMLRLRLLALLPYVLILVGLFLAR